MQSLSYLIPIYMIRSLVLTIAFELLAAVVLGVRTRRDILIVILAQVATNPLVVLITILLNITFGVRGRTLGIFLLEPLAFLTEGLLYQESLEYQKQNPFVLSLVLNCISFFIGELLNRFA